MHPIVRCATGEAHAQGATLVLEDGVLSLNVPFAAAVAPSRLSLVMRNIVGIDLGEHGLAWQVLTPAGEPVASGIEPIRAAGILRSKGREWRREKQTTARFARLDADHERVKETLSGQIIGIVQRLMFQHRALPVFEYEIGNLQRGSQMDRLWGDVVRAFTGGDNDAGRAVRDDRWHTSSATRPVPLAGEWKWRKADGTLVDPPFRPGLALGAGYSSTTCQCCRRSVRKLINDATSITVVAGESVMRVDGNEVALAEPAVADATLDRKAALALTRGRIRMHPSQRQAGDSTLSAFVCLLTDCAAHGAERHSDAAAALEMARRAADRLVPLAV
jgi:hypothetical protein